MEWTEPVAPPIDFAVYGLDASWPDARWFEFYDGELSQPTSGVRLGHQNNTSYVGVATLPRERYDRLNVHRPDGLLAEVAFYGLWWLISLTLPDPDVPRPDNLARTLFDFCTHESAGAAEWPTVRWTVAGESARVPVRRFAGGWTGFTERADVYLAAAGFGVEPDGLTCVPVEDGARYGFDLTAPLRPSHLQAAYEQKAPRNPAQLNGDRWHADHVALWA